MAVIADDVRASRAKIVESAIGSGRLEGLEPSPEAMRIFERFVDGDLTLEEMGREMRAHAQRAYGSVRISGD